MPDTVLPKKAEQLLATLRRLLQYDRSDLDFGIYRILNQRRGDIESFLADDLLPKIHTAFHGESGVGDTSPTALADQVCSDLERFFNRYYDDGDFLSLRRYRAGTYAVPYEGEEVLLHWANKDQYYIKSSTALSALTFVLTDERRVHLEVVAADELSGGVKPAIGEERRFVLAPDPVSISEDGELLLRFVFAKAEKGRKQSDHNADTIAAVLSDAAASAWVASLADNDCLGRQVRQFTAKNTQDYFIHRNLGSFLRRELDFFIKNEILRVDEIDTAPLDEVGRTLARVRVMRDIASQIIDFLHQIEEFQKRVWLKRKAVIDTSWLVTLDRIPDELYAEIAANDEQRQAWVDLLAIDKIAEATADGPAYSAPLTPGFLRRFQHLVLDTRHFDAGFTDRVLEAVGDIDAATTGVIVHGENFQALSLLERRYRGEVGCIYIDPPYNTGGDGFLYKDAYQHSSWLTMMADRLSAARALMGEESSLFASIDDDEHPRLRLVLDAVFGAENFVANVVWQKKYAPANDAKWFSDDHDHIVVFASNKETWRPTKLTRTADVDALYKNPDNDPRGPWMSDNYTCNKTKAQRINLYYPIINPNTGDTVLPSTTRVWGYDEEKHLTHVAEKRLWWGINGTNSTPRLKRFLSDVGGLVPRTIWPHTDAGHNQDAVKDLQALFGTNPFQSPKPVRLMRRVLAVAPGEIVADFFAGSGTFGHAVIDEARAREAPRRFILAESGDHADRVLRPRIIKAIHSGQWEDGAPKLREGVSSLVQCIRIESYEDALDALDLRRTEAQGDLLSTNPEFRKGYLLRYMLDYESRQPLLDRDAFARPFDVRTVATTEGERHAAPVDLVNTFTWLLGLRVDGVATREGVRIVRGVSPENRRVLVLWRTADEMPNEKLDPWFEALDKDVRGPAPDIIYVNGDSTLEMVRPDGERWEVSLLEAEFERLTFLVADDQRVSA